MAKKPTREKIKDLKKGQERGPGRHFSPLPSSTEGGHVSAHAMQTILVEPQALYELWSDMERAPLWQENVISVTRTGEKTTHWVMGNPEEPDGKHIEFDAEMTADEPGKKLAWRSTTPDMAASGEVTFETRPDGRGTLVTLVQTVKLAGNALANAIKGISERSPKQRVTENLRHFKEMAEAGEIPSVKGQPHGPRGVSGALKGWMLGETNPTPPGTSESA